MRTYITFIVLVILFSCSPKDEEFVFEPSTEENLYFPPVNSNTWETTTVSAIGWNTDELQPLLDFFRKPKLKKFYDSA